MTSIARYWGKRCFSFALLALTALSATAQMPVDGISYFLPKTALRFHILVEKRVFTPGQLAVYAEKYMKLPCRMDDETTYRIVGIDMETVGLPDSARHYTVPFDKKHTIFKLERADDGVLVAVNATAPQPTERKPFVAAPHRKPLQAVDFMSQDMLAAGSSAKLAELVAQEIYDIREARAQLTRGEAETMPTDGAQMKLMMQSLDQQETALLQVFKGTTYTDTTETTIAFTPERAGEKQLLFRFSKYLGLTDADDLAGAPYYIGIEDEQVIPAIDAQALPANDKAKAEAYIHVALPGKINVTVADDKDNRLLQKEIYAAQFGRTEALSNDIFGKKQTCHLVLNPITGNVEKIDIELLK